MDPDPALYAAAMQACAAPGSKHAGDAPAIWREMRERLPGQNPGASIAASCVAACEASGNFRQMLDVIGVAAPSVDARHGEEAEAAAKVAVDEAEAKLALAVDAPPPVLTAAAILSGRTAAADAKIAAEAALAAAKRDARTASLQTRARGVRTDLPQASYASLVTACERGGLSSRAVDVFAAAAPRPFSDRKTTRSIRRPNREPNRNNQTRRTADRQPDPAWHERALRAAHAGGPGDAAVEILRSMASECAGRHRVGEGVGARCVRVVARRVAEGTHAASTVGVHQVRGARARDGRGQVGVHGEARDAGAARRGRRRQGGRRRARGARPAVVDAGSDDDDAVKTDASVLASRAAAFAGAGDVAKAAETLERNDDGDALASALAAGGAAGAGGSVLAALSDAASPRVRGVTEGTCGAVVASCASEGRGRDARHDAAIELLGAWGDTHACAAAAAKRLEEGARALESKASSSPSAGSPAAKGGPGEGTAPARGSPVVKEGTSFAFAAGARSKPAAAASGAENGGGEDGGRKGRGSSHAEKRAGSQGKKRGDGEGGKKGHKRGQAGNKGGAKGLGRGAVQAAHRVVRELRSRVGGQGGAVCSSEQAKLGRRDGTRGGGGQALSVKAPAFTPRAAAPEFVPESKD